MTGVATRHDGYQVAHTGARATERTEKRRPLLSVAAGKLPSALIASDQPGPGIRGSTLPFTPFHLGPGALFKAVGGDRFSFMIFGGSQVLMDAEPLLRIIRGDAILHGVSHTIAGAFAIAILSAAIGWPVTNAVLRLSRISDHPIGWKVALSSAFFGTYSHVGLDAVMHADMNPLWPIAHGNSLLGALSVGELHQLCILSGLPGGAILAFRAFRDA